MRKTAYQAILLTGLLSGVPAVWAQTDMTIYDDARRNNWAYWGWATSVDFNQSSVVYSGSKAMAVTMGGPNQAVYLFHGAMDTRFYTELTFWIHGGSTGGQQLRVIARRNGVSQPAVNLPALVSNAWNPVTIPLADLGVSHVTDFSELWIQDRAGSAHPVFYIDEMKLTGAPPVTSLPLTVTVDALQARHPIDPRIYGVNFGSSAALSELNATLNRSGGNAQSRYNWQLNAHNRAADWYFLSSSSGPAVPGEHADNHIRDSLNGGAQPLITVPLMDWMPRLKPNRSSFYSYSVAKYGAQQAVDPWNADGGNGVLTDGTPITWNDPSDANQPADSAFQQGWIEHLTNTWGTGDSGGVRYYCLDNEPSLWDNTHRDIHPVEPTMQELWTRYLDYGQMIKSVDPGAMLIAPEDGAEHNYSDRDSYGGGMKFIPWLLQQSAQFESTNGYRLLDLCSVHYYPSSFHAGTSVFDQRERNRNTRALWDPAFVDASYARSTDRLIPKLRAWSDAYYPGTPVGITEYNWGAENHINGATAQADVWGIFGREELNFSTRWTTPSAGSLVFNAMKMYRNYDGNRSVFGDISVSATGSVTGDDVAPYAAIRSADNTLTLMVINKHLTATAPCTVNLNNFPTLGNAEVWRLDSGNVIQRLSDLPVAGNTLVSELPPQTITLFVIPGVDPPVLGGLQVLAGPQLMFRLDGQGGQQFETQRSTNLLHWVPVQTNTLTTNSVQIVLPMNRDHEYFRVRWLP